MSALSCDRGFSQTSIEAMLADDDVMHQWTRHWNAFRLYPEVSLTFRGLQRPLRSGIQKIGMIHRRLAWPLHSDVMLFQSGRPSGLNNVYCFFFVPLFFPFHRSSGLLYTSVRLLARDSVYVTRLSSTSRTVCTSTISQNLGRGVHPAPEAVRYFLDDDC